MHCPPDVPSSATIAGRMKTQMFHVRIDDRDRERLDRLAAHHEVNAATILRMLIKQAAEALPPAEAPKPAPRRKARASRAA